MVLELEVNVTDSKTVKIYFYLKNCKAAQNTIQKLLNDEKGPKCHKQTSKELFDFHRNLFTEKGIVSKDQILQFLNFIWILQLTQEQSTNFEFLPSEKEFLCLLMSTTKYKSPGNEGFGKEFYETFWEDIKTPLVHGFRSAFDKGKLSHSQR